MGRPCRSLRRFGIYAADLRTASAAGKVRNVATETERNDLDGGEANDASE